MPGLNNFGIGGNPGAVAANLAVVSPPDGSDLFFISEALAVLPSIAALKSALDQLHSAPYKGFLIAQENAVRRVFSAVSERTQNLFNVGCLNCFKAPCPNGVWVDVFFDYLNQDKLTQNIGFRSNTWGVLAGYD